MSKKILSAIMIVLMLFMVTENVYADWWTDASGWGSGMASDAITTSKTSILADVVKIIKAVGNIAFVTVTVLLGVKYIWGGVDSKASVKDSLVTLVIAALVFYGWDTLSALFSPDKFLAGSAEATATKIASTILYVCNFLAVGGVVYVGMKYMMAGADGKAQLKAQSVPMILGIIMVFATVTFLNLIVGLI